MGNYKIFNNDCIPVLKYWHIKKLQIDCIITDPPYFVLPKGKKGFEDFDWDNFKDMETFLNFTKEWFMLSYSLLKPDSSMFIFWSQKYLKEGANIFNPARYLFWQHNNLVLGGNGDFAYDYEPIFYIKKGNPKLKEGKHSCLFNYTKPQSNFKIDKLQHPTQKPIKLLEHIVNILPESTNIILDPFMGSGTTGVAAIKASKEFLGIEKETKYFNIAKQRLSEIN